MGSGVGLGHRLTWQDHGEGHGADSAPHWGDIALAITGIVTLVLGVLAFAWGWWEEGRRDRRDQGDDPSNGEGDVPLKLEHPDLALLYKV
jgi:hypothetical protein